VRRLTILAIAVVLLLAVSGPALAYPKTLVDAVAKAYAPRKTHIDGFCHENIGRYTYVRVDVTVGSSDRTRRVAFQYVKGGWRPLWKDGKLLASVPKRLRAHYRWMLRELNRFCGQ
jgi:hypothetical protein